MKVSKRGEATSEKASGNKREARISLSFLNLIQIGSRSDPRALIGRYFSDHANQCDWCAQLKTTRRRTTVLLLVCKQVGAESIIQGIRSFF